MKAPVHSLKHYVQFGISQIATGTLLVNSIAQAVALQDANNAQEVVEGSIIKAVYIELWLQNEGNLGESIVTVCKNPIDTFGPNFAQQANLFAFSNKKNILFTHQGLTSNDGVSGPVVVLRQWIKIPKSKQRFGLGDRLDMNISNVSASDLVRCGFALYKEYS